MWQKLKKTTNKSFILIGIQFCIMLIFSLIKDYNVTSFADHVMGNALLYNVDITQKVNNYYIILFVLIPVISIGISKLLKYIFDEKDENAINFMNVVSTLGIISTILAFINNQQGMQESRLTIIMLLSINVIIIIGKLISKLLKKEFCFEDLKWAIISSIPIAFFTTLIMHKFSSAISQNMWCWMVSYILGVITLWGLINIPKINKNVLKKSYIIFLITPLIEAIYLEGYNILNQYNIIIISKLRIDIILYSIFALVAVIYYIINRKKNIEYNFEKYYYPIIIIFMVAIMVALPMVTTVSTDFFEQANHATGVYEFLRLGKIPIIENFDAHMMTNQVFGIIYGILNNDAEGAIFCTYEIYRKVIFLLLMYFLLKNIFSRDTSLLVTLFFALENDFGLTAFNIAILAILALINAYKKQDIKSYLLYWLSLAFLCIWQLDIGYSISIATVIVLIYLLIRDKKAEKEIKLKNAIITFASVIGVALIIFIGLCILKNINPITRLIEFLKVAMSNVNWAYSTMGEDTGVKFVVCYIILPLIVIGTLIYETFYSKEKTDNLKIIIMSLGLFYILNFQRGMVRHSIAEGVSVQILNLGLLYIAIFMAVNFYKQDVKKFAILYISLILLSGVLTINNPIEYKNVFDKTISKYQTFELQDSVYTEKMQRVELAEYMKNEFKNLKIIMDELLQEDETYLDLSNQTLLYVLMDREKPVYVNQSPGLLSGDKTQEYFIEQIENYEHGVPVMLKAKGKLLSENLDGIQNDYRYYLVSEYAYQKYTPLAIGDGYEVWVDKTKYEQYLEKISQIQNNEITIVIPEEYIKLETEKSSLGEIARIWAEYGEQENKNNSIKILENIEVNSNEHVVEKNLEEVNKTEGNYLNLKIQSAQQTTLTINLYEDKQHVNTYIITIAEGEHEYKIRTSATYEWYETNINNIGLISNDKINIESMEILY